MSIRMFSDTVYTFGCLLVLFGCNRTWHVLGKLRVISKSSMVCGRTKLIPAMLLRVHVAVFPR